MPFNNFNFLIPNHFLSVLFKLEKKYWDMSLGIYFMKLASLCMRSNGLKGEIRVNYIY